MRWHEQIALCPTTRVNRMDAVVGLALIIVAALFPAYFLGILGTALGGGLVRLGAPPWVSAIAGGAGVLIPTLWLGWYALMDLARRSVVYVLEGREGGLRVDVRRQGLSSFVPSRALGAVVCPDPKPASVRGGLDSFEIAWADLRGARSTDFGIVLDLSADRRVTLVFRGQDPVTLGGLADRIEAKIPTKNV